MGKYLISGLISGTIAGLLLLSAFSYVQLSTDIELMDLLLNLDFISTEEPNIVVQILLHMLVSIVIATILKWFYVNQSRLYMPVMVVIWIIITVLYFILSNSAEEPMELQSYIGWTLWSIFHIGYLELVHVCNKLNI